MVNLDRQIEKLKKGERDDPGLPLFSQEAKPSPLEIQAQITDLTREKTGEFRPLFDSFFNGLQPHIQAIHQETGESRTKK